MEIYSKVLRNEQKLALEELQEYFEDSIKWVSTNINNDTEVMKFRISTLESVLNGLFDILLAPDPLEENEKTT